MSILLYTRKVLLGHVHILVNQNLALVFAEDVLGLGGEEGEGELVKPPEKTLWAKYWMYMIPLGLIIMNVVTQAMNMPEEAAGQAAGQTHQPAAAIQRGTGSTVRRR